MAKKFFEENLKQVNKRLNLLYDDVFNIYSYGELSEEEKEEFLKIVDSIYNLNKKYNKFIRNFSKENQNDKRRNQTTCGSFTETK